MLGGISAASDPASAMQAERRRTSEPKRVISGIAIFVNTAAFTMVEPDAAPNAAEDMTVAIARPPRSLPSQRYAVRKHSVTMPAAVANEPIRMKSGITARLKLLVVLNGTAANCAPAASGPTVSRMPTNPARPSATPMCTPSARHPMRNGMTIQPAAWAESSSMPRSAHLGRVLRRGAVQRRRLAVPRTPEVPDHVEHELQHEKHRAGGEQRPRRVEREADCAHRRLLDLPAIRELAEAVPGEQHEEQEREQMGEQIRHRLQARGHVAMQDLDADVATLLLRERERAEDDQHHGALGDLERSGHRPVEDIGADHVGGADQHGEHHAEGAEQHQANGQAPQDLRRPPHLASSCLQRAATFFGVSASLVAVAVSFSHCARKSGESAFHFLSSSAGKGLNVPPFSLMLATAFDSKSPTQAR